MCNPPHTCRYYIQLLHNTTASFKWYNSSILQQVFVFFEDVEALACRRAINFAAEIGIHEVIMEGDAQIVID